MSGLSSTKFYFAGAVFAGLSALGVYAWRRSRALSESPRGQLSEAKPIDYKVQTRSRFRTGQDKAKILCCRSVSEYAACINATVGAGDSVLVVNSTDKDDEVALSIKSRAGNITKFQGKDVWDVKFLQSVGRISVVCINYTDAFGNFLLCDSIAMIRLLRSVFEPHLRYIVIKDKGLSRHADTYMGYDVFLQVHERRKVIEPKHRETTVICAVGVSEYRMAIPHIVRKGDKVLEIGCARGTTIAMAAKYIGGPEDGGMCVGIDMGKVCIDNSRTDHNELLRNNHHVYFEIGNGWDIPGLLKFATDFNVIFVDIGGISGSDGEFEGVSFIRQLMSAFGKEHLRYIVVKSRCLRDHALSFCTAGKFLKND